MKKRSQLEKRFAKNVMRCIDLRVKEKKSWLESVSLFSDELLMEANADLEKMNRINDACIKAALAKDKNRNFLMELKTKFREIKSKALQMDEVKTKIQSEKLLKTELENL